MKLYPQVNCKSHQEPKGPRPSYELPPPEGKLSKGEQIDMIRNQRWLVTIEHNDGTKEGFVLFHLLSSSHAEVIRGRATRVWKAWSQKEYNTIKRPELRRVSY